MALADERNTDLAYDLLVLRNCAERYGKVAEQLRTMSSDLDTCLQTLKDSGWTTPAGTAFHKMVQTNWEENIDKYADLLDTLRSILILAAAKYDTLTTQEIAKIVL